MQQSGDERRQAEAELVDAALETLKDEVFNALVDVFMHHNRMSEDHAAELAARCVAMLRARGTLRGALS